jgi:hypothetical protein
MMYSLNKHIIFTRICLILSVVLFLEYICVVNEFEYTISSPLRWLGNTVEDLSFNIGVYLAVISSFLTLLNLKILGQAFWNFILPLGKICCFWWYAYEGYTTQLFKYKSPYLVGLGSITLVILVGIIIKSGSKFIINCKRNQAQQRNNNNDYAHMNKRDYDDAEYSVTNDSNNHQD